MEKLTLKALWTNVLAFVLKPSYIVESQKSAFGKAGIVTDGFCPKTEIKTHQRRANKARWFQSVPVAERMEFLCSITDLIVENNPQVLQKSMLNRLQDVFASLQARNVKYVVIGGSAAQRATGSMEI